MLFKKKGKKRKKKKGIKFAITPSAFVKTYAAASVKPINLKPESSIQQLTLLQIFSY